MSPLSRIEEMILLAVYQLPDNAYGITIRSHLEALTQKSMSVGAIYIPLERLTRQGMLTPHVGAPTQARGGRSKRLYTITVEGIQALEETRRLHDAMWTGITELQVPDTGRI